MAIIHRATITPTKQELLTTWLGGPVEVLASYRFDDPAGLVGVEGFVLQHGPGLEHAVLTYRGAPLEEDAGARLVCTMEHSALGRRWVHDGTTDPVAVGCFRRAVLGRQEQAVLELWADGDRVGTREQSVRLTVRPGSGTAPDPDRAELRIHRVLDPSAVGTGPSLVASWSGGEAVLAELVAAPR